MKLLSLFAIIAGLGLAQDKPTQWLNNAGTAVTVRTSEVKPEDRLVNSGSLLIGDPPDGGKLHVHGTPPLARTKIIYIGGVAPETAPFRIDHSIPGVFVVQGRDGKAITRCVAATQKCTPAKETK